MDNVIIAGLRGAVNQFIGQNNFFMAKKRTVDKLRVIGYNEEKKGGESVQKQFDQNTIRVENIEFSAFFECFENETETTGVLDSILLKTVHTHAYAELFLCFDLGIVIKTEHAEIYLNPGEILLVPPGIQHVMLPHKSRGMSVGFSYSLLKNKSRHDFYGLINRLCKGELPRVLCQGVTPEMQLFNETQKSDILRVMQLLEFLLQMAEQSGNEKCKEYSAGQNPERDLGRTSAVEMMFHTCFMTDFHAEDAARQLHLSKRQLDRVIRRRFGMSFREVMTEYRMQAACKMLTGSELCAEEIGYAVGYNNKSAFYAAFRRKYGMTPMQYRNTQK